MIPTVDLNTIAAYDFFFQKKKKRATLSHLEIYISRNSPSSRRFFSLYQESCVVDEIRREKFAFFHDSNYFKCRKLYHHISTSYFR